MVRVGPQQHQRLAVVLAKLRVALEKARGASVVLIGEDQHMAHDNLARRFMCASTDSLTKRPAARSAWL